MVHGGGFVVGSTMDIPFNQVRWWTEQGFLVASLEYRLAPQYV
jgi:acetyl esterase/lipase